MFRENLKFDLITYYDLDGNVSKQDILSSLGHSLENPKCKTISIGDDLGNAYHIWYDRLHNIDISNFKSWMEILSSVYIISINQRKINNWIDSIMSCFRDAYLCISNQEKNKNKESLRLIPEYETYLELAQHNFKYVTNLDDWDIYAWGYKSDLEPIQETLF